MDHPVLLLSARKEKGSPERGKLWKSLAHSRSTGEMGSSSRRKSPRTGTGSRWVFALQSGNSVQAFSPGTLCIGWAFL